MLYTLHALSELQEKSNIILTQQHYTIFDSREFTSNVSLEDTFDRISSNFNTAWFKVIKPFLDSMIKNGNEFKAKGGITLIPEEGIYLNLQGLDANNVEYFNTYNTVHGTHLRLIGINNTTDESKNYSFSIFDSPVYDPIHGTYYKPISIFFYKKIFQETDQLNDILLRIANYIILNYMDNVLSSNNNVVLNRILVNVNEDANKDAIILPESLNISDTRFLFSYFLTLFKTLNSVLNTNMLSTFKEYSNIITLPDLFSFSMTDEEAAEAEAKVSAMSDEEANRYALGFKQKIYSRIWDLSKKSSISDMEYIDICSDIMRNITINLDNDAYEAMRDYNEQLSDESEEESTGEDE